MKINVTNALNEIVFDSLTPEDLATTYTLAVGTQTLENYAFCEGGEYWKPKGGSNYLIRGIPTGVSPMEAVEAMGIPTDTPAFREYVVTVEEVPENYMFGLNPNDPYDRMYYRECIIKLDYPV